MSTFPGLIEEIPSVSVDCFIGSNFNSSIFFLSHCHTDHMHGLDNKFFENLRTKQQYLYCTPISKPILINIHKLDDNLANTIQTIDGCIPMVLSYRYNDQILYLTVTCIPAGHCPGSVMFLFENSEYCILYTGDFRIDINDLSKLKPLHNNINGKMMPKQFDTIYLDTTFFSLDFKYLPSRRKALHEICKVVQSWITQNNKNIVILECAGNYGPEHLFVKLSNALNIRVHVNDFVFNIYTRIPELVNCITDDPYASQIHACMGKKKYSLECRSDIPKEFVITVVPSVIRWRNKDLHKNIFEWDYKWKRFYACYSCHSSYDELEAFIKYFHPKKIFPCVCPANVNFSDFQNKLHENIMKPNPNITNNFCLNSSRYKYTPMIKSKTLNLSDDDE